jgi:hypothetical protein
MVAYGLAGRYQAENVNPPDMNTNFVGDPYSLVLMFIFTLVGFGLLLNVYKYGTWLGTGSAIIVVAMSIVLGPLLQKFWFCVFISSFKDVVSSSTITSNTVGHIISQYGDFHVKVTFLSLRTSLLTSISVLVVMTALVGRVTLFQLIKFTSLFHLFWPLNYYLLLWFNIVRNDFHLVNNSAYNP